jgi:hypothetical protein
MPVADALVLPISSAPINAAISSSGTGLSKRILQILAKVMSGIFAGKKLWPGGKRKFFEVLKMGISR